MKQFNKKVKNAVLILVALSSSFGFSTEITTEPKKALTNEEATKLVNDTFLNTVVASTQHFCVMGTMTCRTLITYKDKTTNLPIDSFRISFYSAERMVAASEFYIKLAESADVALNRYARLIDKTFDGAINIERTDEVQTVLKTEDSVTIKDLFMPKLGTTLIITSDLVFNKTMAFLDGIQTDTVDPTVKTPIRIEYLALSR